MGSDRELLTDLALIGKVITPIMKIDAIAMTRQRDIGGVTIETGRGEHMDAVNSDALRLVHCRGIAMIDRGVVLRSKATDRPSSRRTAIRVAVTFSS